MKDQKRHSSENRPPQGEQADSRPLREEVARKVFWKRLATGAIAVAGAALTLLVRRSRR